MTGRVFNLATERSCRTLAEAVAKADVVIASANADLTAYRRAQEALILREIDYLADLLRRHGRPEE